MKKFKKLILLFLSVVSIDTANAQTVDEVINKYIDAVGGKEKMLALKTIKMDGAMSVNGLDIGIVTTISGGIGVRTDISVPGMGEGYQIMTPTKGWSYMPFQGQTSPEEAPADVVANSQTSLDLQSALLNYKEKGHTVELLGKEKADAVDCFKIKFTHKNGKVVIYFIDAVNYYRVKVTGKTIINGEETDVETTYSNFKKTAEGYVFPFEQTSIRGTITYSSIEVNKPVDVSIFEVK